MKKVLLVLLAISMVVSTISCNKGEEIEMVYNNDVFTEELYGQITAIRNSFGKPDAVVKTKKEIQEVYSYFSALTLTETEPWTQEEIRYGFTAVEFECGDTIMEVTMHNDRITVRGIPYTVDKDIVDSVITLLNGESSN